MVKTYRVVKIISDYLLVINAGKNDVKKGDEIEIFVPGENVIDEETGESLGTLDKIKASIEVTNVYEKMSVCKNAETKTIDLPSLMAFGFTREETKRLNVDPEQISGGLDYENKITIGDLVRKSFG